MKKRKKRHYEACSLKAVTKQNYEQIFDCFIPGEKEEITETLIEELVLKYGMPRDYLQFMQREGFTYCRKTNSFFSKPVCFM